MTDLNHVNDEQAAAYLDTQDAAADWTPGGDGFAASFDEWNAKRWMIGLPPGDFSDYLDAIGQRNPIVALLARKWATEDNGAGDMPARAYDGEVPF